MEDLKRPCNNFFKLGACPFNEKCNYSHVITEKFVQSTQIINILKDMGLEIRKIDNKPKKNMNIPDLNSEVDFPVVKKNKNLISKLIQTEDFTKSETCTLSTQTDILDDLSSNNDKYDEGYNHGISELSEKIIGDLLHRSDTLNIMGNNGFVHLYFCSNIKSISDTLKK